MKTLLLSKTDVQNAVSMDDVIVAVEEAYKAYQQGQVEQPPIQGMGIQDNTTAEAIYKVALEKGMGSWFEFI